MSALSIPSSNRRTAEIGASTNASDQWHLNHRGVRVARTGLRLVTALSWLALLASAVLTGIAAVHLAATIMDPQIPDAQVTQDLGLTGLAGLLAAAVVVIHSGVAGWARRKLAALRHR